MPHDPLSSRTTPSSLRQKSVFVLMAFLTAAGLGAAAIASAASSTQTPDPTSPAVTVPGVPRYFNYTAPPGTGDNAGEPSIGINYNTEQVFSNSGGPIPNGGTSLYFGGFLPYMLKVTFDDCGSPAKATWDKKPLLTASTIRVYGDPILFTDHATGRTFVCQLEGLTPLGSTIDFTDNDGDNFTPTAGNAAPSCVDHETIGGGIFHAPIPPLPPPFYPNAVYYASQCVADATCELSVTGGLNFIGPGTQMFTIVDCTGLHGHLKVAPNDGTVYVANKACGGGVPLLNGGEAAVIVSENNGATWTIRTVPNQTTKGDDDASVGVANDGTIYLGYQLANGNPGIAVSHDKGASWVNVTNLATSSGVQNCAFPAVVAGDGNRAAFAYFGSTTAGASEQASFPGVWYLYISSTFDGGATWTTVNATPGDPIQRGGICGSGTCRNLLDFFDATIDKEGRVVVGSEDGCVGNCVNGPPNSFTAKAVIARQSGGKRMFSTFDPVEPRVAEAPAVTGDQVGTVVHLYWQAPDNGGADVIGYKVYRKVNAGSFVLLSTQGVTNYVDTVNPADANVYAVTALNSQGEGPYCAFSPSVGGPSPCKLPGILAINDVNPDGTDNDVPQNVPPDATTNVRRLYLAEPYAAGLNQLTFTLEVAPGGLVVPPESEWFIVWNRKTIAADGSDRRFVAMKADATGALSFVYGDFGPPLPIGGVPPVNANTPMVLGNADFGSFNLATGVITIRLANSKADATPLVAGDQLAGLNVRTYYGRPDGGQRSQNNAQDITENGSYTLVGNAACFCTVDQPPVAALTADRTEGDATLVVNFDASGSFDPDPGDAVASYTINYGDGSPPVTQGTPFFQHPYTMGSGPSGFFVTLTVTDLKCNQQSLNVASLNIKVNGGETPTLVSLVSAKAEPGRGVTLTWYTADSQLRGATVYRMGGAVGWQALDRVSPDGSGMMVYHDPNVLGGARYGYRLGVLEPDGQEAYVGETWVSVPRLELRFTALGNPSPREVDFALALDRDGPVHVGVFSPTGRRITVLANGWMPAGRHALRWAGRDASGNRVPSGVYIVRATTGSGVLVTRVQLLQ